MRVISGKFKGHQLASFSASHIRPTTDRVKESIFNKLMPYNEGALVLDLFSGTGSLGIEALSRGAQFIQCVENHDKSIAIIKQNLKKLKIDGEIQIAKSDVIKFLKNYQGPSFDIVLIDPPFTKKMGDEVMRILGENDAICGSDGIVVIETSEQEPIENQYGVFDLLDRKDYGDKKVSYYTKEVQVDG